MQEDGPADAGSPIVDSGMSGDLGYAVYRGSTTNKAGTKTTFHGVTVLRRVNGDWKAIVDAAGTKTRMSLNGILVLYLAASAASIVVYAVDKSAARHGRWRASESTLHLLAIIGGWPGALVAQQVFHHKSRKPSFQAPAVAFVFRLPLRD